MSMVLIWAMRTMSSVASNKSLYAGSGCLMSQRHLIAADLAIWPTWEDHRMAKCGSHTTGDSFRTKILRRFVFHVSFAYLRFLSYHLCCDFIFLAHVTQFISTTFPVSHFGQVAGITWWAQMKMYIQHHQDLTSY